ncbi:MAG: hypothetical protein LBM77_10650 [Spirochaetaceae bacterium]|jgi:hypothetical protein|nr:hypothetical protein [Spirochaetaceae bacterium]
MEIKRIFEKTINESSIRIALQNDINSIIEIEEQIFKLHFVYMLIMIRGEKTKDFS